MPGSVLAASTFRPHNAMKKHYYYFRFTDERSEAQNS